MIVYAPCAPLANVCYVGPVTNHFEFDGICEDCGLLIRRNTEDSVPYMEDCRCKRCQAERFRYMEEQGKAEACRACCGGCGSLWHELKSGETVHGCECGMELTEKECFDQIGLCATCGWLNS